MGAILLAITPIEGCMVFHDALDGTAQEPGRMSAVTAPSVRWRMFSCAGCARERCGTGETARLVDKTAATLVANTIRIPDSVVSLRGDSGTLPFERSAPAAAHNLADLPVAAGRERATAPQSSIRLKVSPYCRREPAGGGI